MTYTSWAFANPTSTPEYIEAKWNVKGCNREIKRLNAEIKEIKDGTFTPKPSLDSLLSDWTSHVFFSVRDAAVGHENLIAPNVLQSLQYEDDERKRAQEFRLTQDAIDKRLEQIEQYRAKRKDAQKTLKEFDYAKFRLPAHFNAVSKTKEYPDWRDTAWHALYQRLYAFDSHHKYGTDIRSYAALTYQDTSMLLDALDAFLRSVHIWAAFDDKINRVDVLLVRHRHLWVAQFKRGDVSFTRAGRDIPSAIVAAWLPFLEHAWDGLVADFS